MKDWAEFLHLTSRILEVAPLLPFVLLWICKCRLPVEFKPIYYYVVVELLLYILKAPSRMLLRNDIYIFHLSTLFTALLLSNVYLKLFNSRKVSKFILSAVLIFLLIAFLDAFFINGIFTDLNSYSQAFGSIVLVSLALLHIVQISRTSMDLLKQPEFFFSISVLIYFSYAIVTCVAANIIYNSGYDAATRIRFDRIITAPDALLFAVHMGLFAWMFSFFPFSVNPLRALPQWLHYGRWYVRPYKLLGQSSLGLRRVSTAEY
jgi:hypothetical protein